MTAPNLLKTKGFQLSDADAKQGTTKLVESLVWPWLGFWVEKTCASLQEPNE
jgi:hypothetical protein